MSQKHVKNGMVPLLKKVLTYGFTLSSDGLTDRKGFHILNFCAAVAGVEALVSFEVVRSSAIVKNSDFYAKSLRRGFFSAVAALRRAEVAAGHPVIRSEDTFKRACVQVS